MGIFKLALDAGHGMDTQGRRIPGTLDPEEHREWWLNDRVCRYIAQAAAEYEGFQVFRVDDVSGLEDVPMEERCRRANSWGADLYYSAHHNAGVGGGTGGGVVAYSLNEGTRGAMWRDELYGAIVGETGLVGNRASPKATANFYVLRNTAMPAVLMEHGFMDSAADVPVILSEEYAKGVGRAVADCIARRQGLEKLPEGQLPGQRRMSDEEIQAIAETAAREIAVSIARESARAATEEALGPHYTRLGDVTRPGYRRILDKLVNLGYLRGREGTGEDLILDMSETGVRTLVILGRTLEGAGLL
ncbi:MAG: N-acetylmuramoyl-L-alanine amidase [Clostridiales bacterium]|nr:N-acetylmuramoyl-L-alanine amidase [Clostridiales bacterium]